MFHVEHLCPRMCQAQRIPGARSLPPSVIDRATPNLKSCCGLKDEEMGAGFLQVVRDGRARLVSIDWRGVLEVGFGKET